MSILASWGNLTGWKAVAAAAVIVAVVGLKAWNRIPRYRQFAVTPVSVKADESYAYSFTAKENLKLKIDLTGLKGSKYLVCVMTQDAATKLRNADPSNPDAAKDIPIVFQQEGDADLSVDNIALTAGPYVVFVEGGGGAALSCKLKLSVYE